MRRWRQGELVTMVLMATGVCALTSSALAQAGATKQEPPKTREAQSQQAPTKARGARKAEVARLRDQFAAGLIAQETRAWEEEKNKNAEFFRRVMTEQFVAAEPDGKRYTKADVLPLISTVQMTSFELTDFHVIRAGRDAAVITYRAVVREAPGGNETRVLATTVWVRRGEEWKMTFHQKTPAP